MTQGIAAASSTGNLDLDGPQGFGDIVRMAEKVAPNGIGWENWRPSTNVEDARGKPPISAAEVETQVRKAELESQHDGEPNGFIRPMMDLVMGKDKWVDGYLRNGTIADLVNAVSDYVKSGGPQKDIEAYHATKDYKEREALRDKILKIFNEKLKRK